MTWAIVLTGVALFAGVAALCWLDRDATPPTPPTRNWRRWE